MITAIALALVIVAAIVAVVELVRTRWQSLMAWGLLVLCLSLLVDKM
jgi:Flp pilus assembly pilin Flp